MCRVAYNSSISRIHQHKFLFPSALKVSSVCPPRLLLPVFTLSRRPNSQEPLDFTLWGPEEERTGEFSSVWTFFLACMLFPILGRSWEPLKGVWHLFALQHYISVPSAAWKRTLSQWQLGFSWIPPASSWVKPSQLRSPTHTCRSEPERRSDRSWHTSSPSTAAGATSASNADKLTAKRTRVRACACVYVCAWVLVCVKMPLPPLPDHWAHEPSLHAAQLRIYNVQKEGNENTPTPTDTHTHTDIQMVDMMHTFSCLAGNLELLLIFNQLSFLLQTFVSQADRCRHGPAVKEKQIPVQQQMDKPQGEKELPPQCSTIQIVFTGVERLSTKKKRRKRKPKNKTL